MYAIICLIKVVWHWSIFYGSNLSRKFLWFILHWRYIWKFKSKNILFREIMIRMILYKIDLHCCWYLSNLSTKKKSFIFEEKKFHRISKLKWNLNILFCDEYKNCINFSYVRLNDILGPRIFRTEHLFNKSENVVRLWFAEL